MFLHTVHKFSNVLLLYLLFLLDQMDPRSLSMDYWNMVNIRQGDFKLSYSGIQVTPSSHFFQPSPLSLCMLPFNSNHKIYLNLSGRTTEMVFIQPALAPVGLLNSFTRQWRRQGRKATSACETAWTKGPPDL